MKDPDRIYIDPNQLTEDIWYRTRKTYICSSFKDDYEQAKQENALTPIRGDLLIGPNTYLEITASVKSIEQPYGNYGLHGKAAGLIESPDVLKGRKITLANDSVSWYLGIGPVGDE